MNPELRSDPKILRFVEAATRYCELFEQHPEDLAAWMEVVQVTLAELYSLGAQLPDDLERPEPEQFPLETFDISDEQWNVHFRRMGGILGERGFYRLIYDPNISTDSKNDPVIGNLADDLADIYRDLKPGLEGWRKGVDGWLPEILFEWKTGFMTHWGYHAVDAMRILHWRIWSG